MMLNKNYLKTRAFCHIDDHHRRKNSTNKTPDDANVKKSENDLK